MYEGDHMLKRVSLFCILLLFLFGVAQAEIECSCSAKKCECFVQRGDEGVAVKAIAALLIDQGYMPDKRINTFSEEMHNAVMAFQSMHGLDETGMLDDETLTLLIWGLDDESDEEQSVVYVPTHGGEKYHRTITCSSMQNPRKMSLRNADALSIDYCEKCSKPSEEQETEQ